MTLRALGMIETIGLPTAIAAADAATKAANVQLLGYDLATGGLVTVKVRGDVGAVQAAVRAGAQAGAQIGQVVSMHVIPRPHTDLETLTAQVRRGPAAARPEPEPRPAAGRPPRKKKTAPPVPDTTAEEPATTGWRSPEDEAGAESSAAPVIAESVPVMAEEAAAPLPPAIEGEQVITSQPPAGPVSGTGDVCNLCGDPACPRRKGQPTRLCMHWEAPPALS